MKIKDIHDPYCVLNIPLYRLDGTSFMDRSAYGNLCTVTGAIWGSQGRTFDGTSYIQGSGGDVNFTAFTLLGFVKPTLGSPIALTFQVHNGTDTKEVVSDTTFQSATWAEFACNYDGSFISIDKDGQSDSTPVAATGTIRWMTAFFAEVLLTGIEGEILLYSRNLSVGEKNNWYNFMKWRY